MHAFISMDQVLAMALINSGGGPRDAGQLFSEILQRLAAGKSWGRKF